MRRGAPQLKRILATGFSILLAAALHGCGGEAREFRLTDLTGADFGKQLDLADHNGRPRTLADFRGKVVVVFFGFTHCPDVCPATLAEFARLMRELGPERDQVQVLFVTVDPERDTAQALKQYVSAFEPTFLGLRGDAEATARAAREFKVFYQKQPLAGGSYSVDHLAGTYILDRGGRLRLFARHGQGAADLLHDIRILLAPG